MSYTDQQHHHHWKEIMELLTQARAAVGSTIEASRWWLIDRIAPGSRHTPEHPHPVHTAQAALALASIAREAHGDYQRLWNMAAPMMQEMDPFHFADVSVSLAAMVASVADEDDYARFSNAVMRAEIEAVL